MNPWPAIIAAALVAAACFYWAPTRSHAPYINVQTCMFSTEEYGSKLGNICSRLDPDTHWALRQRI